MAKAIATSQLILPGLLSPAFVTGAGQLEFLMKIFWLEQTDTDLPAGGTSMAPVDAQGQDGRARRLQWVAPGNGHGQDWRRPAGWPGSDGAKPELEWLSARELDQA